MTQKNLDIDLAVEYINTHSGLNSRGRCARSIRLALSAGGLIFQNFPHAAKDYGHTLLSSGFSEVLQVGYSPRKGDIIVLQNYGDNTSGHIAMYTGTQWVSDFRQRDMWAGPGYRTHQPSYTIYRFDN